MVVPVWFTTMLLRGEGGGEEDRLFIAVVLVPFYLIGFYFMLSPLLRSLEHSKVVYRVSKHRVVLTKGMSGQRIHSIPLDSIRSFEVRKSLFSKISNCGDVILFTGTNDGLPSKPNVMLGIQDPEEAASIIEELRARGHRKHD